MAAWTSTLVGSCSFFSSRPRSRFPAFSATVASRSSTRRRSASTLLPDLSTWFTWARSTFSARSSASAASSRRIASPWLRSTSWNALNLSRTMSWMFRHSFTPCGPG